MKQKVRAGLGAWLAVWLLPVSKKYERSACPEVMIDSRTRALNGETDFLEAVGYLPGQIIPSTHSYNSLSREPLTLRHFVS